METFRCEFIDADDNAHLATLIGFSISNRGYWQAVISNGWPMVRLINLSEIRISYEEFAQMKLCNSHFEEWDEIEDLIQIED